jgi:hypothetical protein
MDAWLDSTPFKPPHDLESRPTGTIDANAVLMNDLILAELPKLRSSSATIPSEKLDPNGIADYGGS